MKSHGKNERYFIAERTKNLTSLEGSQALPVRPLDKGQRESEYVMMVRSGGLRKGPRNFDFVYY